MGQLAGVAALFAGAARANAEPINLIDDKTKNLDYKNNIADQARDVDIDKDMKKSET